MDARLQPLVDVLVELVARDIANENAVAPAKENDGVEDQRGKHTARTHESRPRPSIEMVRQIIGKPAA